MADIISSQPEAHSEPADTFHQRAIALGTLGQALATSSDTWPAGMYVAVDDSAVSFARTIAGRSVPTQAWVVTVNVPKGIVTYRERRPSRETDSFGFGFGWTVDTKSSVLVGEGGVLTASATRQVGRLGELGELTDVHYFMLDESEKQTRERVWAAMGVVQRSFSEDAQTLSGRRRRWVAGSIARVFGIGRNR